MRRLLVLATVTLCTGCRAPAIPAQPTSSEYAVYNAWIDQDHSSLPHEFDIAVGATTLVLNQSELQFQQCLPRRMAHIFDAAPSATLTSSSNPDWLLLADGRRAVLQPNGSRLSFDRPTKLVRVSRVAFTRFRTDAYLWVEHRICQPSAAGSTCTAPSGALIHGQKSDGTWTFEETTCQILAFPS